MPRFPTIKGDAVFVPEGMPDDFDYSETNVQFVERLRKCKVRNHGNGWEFVKTQLPKTFANNDTDKVERFEWYRLHAPPVAKFEEFKAWKEAGGVAVYEEAESEDQGETEAPDAQDSLQGEVDAPPTVSAGQSVDGSSTTDDEAPEGKDAPRLVGIPDDNAVMPIDVGRDLDTALAESVSLEDEVRVLKWVRDNINDILARRVKTRDAPGRSAWWLANIAMLNPVQFETKFWDRLIQFEKEREAEKRAAVGKLLDHGGKLPQLLKRLKANAG
jgi:hypothetical protein